MIAVVETTSGALTERLCARHRDEHIERWAPLATPAWLGRVPGSVGAFARRRHRACERSAPVLLVADGALRAWASGRTDRRYLAEFSLRAAIDAWAAREVRRRRPSVVIAPSLAARHTFAAAREIGARTVLVVDVPLLRALHRDLDRAAAVWPDRAFLRRFRAPSWAIARQEAERVLADEIVVRGAYARELCIADGFAETRVSVAPSAAHPMPVPARPTRRIRLAGLAAARHGVDTALAIAAALDLTLVVRIGEGTEPAELATHPRVATDDGPVDAVMCPAVCETYAPELRAAGIPVIASPMASADGRGPDPFDADAFAQAVSAALAARYSQPTLAPSTR